MDIIRTRLKNVTNGTQYITAILRKYKENEKVDDTEILSLLQYHPTKHINIDNIDYLIIKLRKPFNKLSLFYKYKNSEIEDDISYILCIKNVFGKYNRDKQYDEDVMSAFRNESHMCSKKMYFINNTKKINNLFYGICDNCKIQTSNITTDHYPMPYTRIFSNFIELENMLISNIEIYENNVNEIRIKNEDIAIKWRLYHDKYATYRLLCKSCNSHFGSYKINSII